MQILSHSPQETIDIGKRIAKSLRSPDIICLFGEFGSGKTMLTKGIAAGLGIKKSDITSPSFVLMQQHSDGRIPLYHFDLYRLTDPKSIEGIGYEEYLFDEGVSVLEWADRLKFLLPEEYLKIELLVKSDSRRLLKINAVGRSHRKLLKEINENLRY